MKAAAVFPQRRDVGLIEHPEPRIETPAEVKIRVIEVGVCGTDRDICNFQYGTSPAGSDYFVLGHESLGEVVEAGPDAGGLKAGDVVVGVVRLPCAVPGCPACRAGRQDFCTTSRYRERGIKDLHGFMTEYVVEDYRNLHVLPAALREVGVLIEPLTIAEKALLELCAIDRRLAFERGRLRAVVVGAGPIGLLGAMLLVKAGFETWVYSRSRKPNPKAAIADAIGATYVSSMDETPERFAARVGAIDVIYEAAGAAQAAMDLINHLGPNGVFILTGVPRRGERVTVDAQALAWNLVTGNQVVMGTVNAGPDAFAAAVRDLGLFLERWPAALRALLTGRYPLARFLEPVTGRVGGIKNVIAIE